MSLDIVIVYVLCHVREQLSTGLHGVMAVHDDIGSHVCLEHGLAQHIHRHPQSLVLGVAVHPGGDQRERHRLAAVFLSQRQRRAVTGGQHLFFSVMAVLVYGPHRVDDVLTGQAGIP